MLWDLIRDFFVQHIFGGCDSLGVQFSGLVMMDGDTDELWYTSNLPIGKIDFYGEPLYISMGDWLSTTATIISISIIVVLCCLFIKKMVSTISNLFNR